MGGNATSSTPETTDVSTKPRRRARDGYFWQLIILRVPMAVFAVALIVYLANYVRKWQGVVRRPEDVGESDGKDALGQCGLPLSMASVSLAVATWEITARLVPQHKYGPRSLEFLTIFLDLLVVGLGIPGWFNFSMAEYYTSSGYPTPWDEDENLAATLIIIFWILHCIIAIVGCSTCADCCGCAPASTKLKKAAVTTNAPVQPAQRPDLEHAVAMEPLPNYKQSTGLEEIEPATTNPGDPPSYPEVVRLKDLSRSE